MTDWWSYPYNFSNGTEVDGVGKFFIKYPSFIMNNYFAIGFIVLIFVSIFGIMLAFGSKRALMVASFISGVFSIWFASLGVLNPIITIVLIILTIVGALGSKEEQSL